MIKIRIKKDTILNWIIGISTSIIAVALIIFLYKGITILGNQKTNFRMYDYVMKDLYESISILEHDSEVVEKFDISYMEIIEQLGLPLKYRIDISSESKSYSIYLTVVSEEIKRQIIYNEEDNDLSMNFKPYMEVTWYTGGSKYDNDFEEFSQVKGKIKSIVIHLSKDSMLNLMN